GAKAPFALATSETSSQVALELFDLNALLLHGITLTHGNSVILERIKIIGHAEWRTDFVLEAVATTDSARDVIVHVPHAAELTCSFLAWRGKLFLLRQRKHRNLDWRQTTIQLQEHAGISAALGIRYFFLGISFDQKCHHGTAQASRWFNNVWNPAFFSGLVEVGQVLTRV